MHVPCCGRSIRGLGEAGGEASRPCDSPSELSLDDLEDLGVIGSGSSGVAKKVGGIARHRERQQ
eukprot:361365-Chlamydomonas_euryale.AAC.14